MSERYTENFYRLTETVDIHSCESTDKHKDRADRGKQIIGQPKK
jgi:hypothetical protein